MRRLAAATCVLILLIAARLAADSMSGAGLVDDAYIFLRYADNAARGLGAVFNPGERVEGYSSPLWLGMLVAAAHLPWDLPAIARWLGILLGLLVPVALYGLGAPLMPEPGGRRLLAAGALGLALDPASAFWSGSGMETSLMSLLLIVTVLLFLRATRGDGSMWAAGFGLALSSLARPEALALAPPLWLGAPRGRRVGLIVPMALPLLHLIWRIAYYGSWLPNTWYAKAGVPLAPRLMAGAWYVGSFELACAPMLIGIAAAAVASARRQEAAEEMQWKAPFAAVVLWIGAVVLEGGDHFALYRFLVPIVPLLVWLLAHFAASIHGTRNGAGSWVAAAVILALMLGQSVILLTGRGAAKAAQEVSMASAWAEAGRWLGRSVPPDMQLASIMVGAIPYYSRLPTLDLLGLNDREIARYGRIAPEAVIGHQKHHPDYVLERQPDIILYRSAGWAVSPPAPGGVPAGAEYDYALLSLLEDPRTSRLYTTASYRMPNGKYVGFMVLRTSRERLPPAE